MMDPEGLFESATPIDKELVMEMVSKFHFRNGTKNPDGSMGAIYITPGQLRDVLAYCIKYW